MEPKSVESFESLVSRVSDRVGSKLRAWLARTEKGDNVDLRSQLWHSEPRGSVIDRVKREVLDHFELFSPLDDFEIKEEGKIGAYSIQLPWSERRSNIRAFWQDRTNPPFTSKPYLDALRKVASLVPTSSLSPLSLDDALDTVARNTLSGLPSYEKKGIVLGQLGRRARDLLNSGEGKLWPSVDGWRGQPTGPSTPPKQRDIWIYDALDNVIGAMFLYPVLDALRSNQLFAAYTNLREVDTTITRMLATAHQYKVNIYSTDFDQFDATVPGRVIQDIASIVKDWFTMSDSEGLAFDNIVDWFITGTILTPDGVLGDREGGIPSGANFTSLFGSLINYFAHEYVAHTTGSTLRSATFLGDDAVTVFDPDPGAEVISSKVGELNLVQNTSKQYVSKNSVHYLQRVHSVDYSRDGVNVGVRPIMRALNGMLSYERRRPKSEWSKWMAAARTIMQLENTSSHPAFSEFVEFTVQGDGVLSSFDPVEIFSRAGGTAEVEEVLGYKAFPFTSASVRGVATFETTKLLRSRLK